MLTDGRLPPQPFTPASMSSLFVRTCPASIRVGPRCQRSERADQFVEFLEDTECCISEFGSRNATRARLNKSSLSMTRADLVATLQLFEFC